MKANKWIVLLALSVLGAGMVHAQGIKVYKKDGMVVDYSYNEVDSLVAYNYSYSGDGYIAGHEYVDLGLSVKWATCNVGASSPSDYGNYYAWGEVAPKSEYTAANSVTYDKTTGDIAGDPRYDAARALWGGTWRLPMESECRELVNCSWTWTTVNGKQGYCVTGRNGNSIFLPATGCRNGSSLDYAGSIGFYWSSTPNESDSSSACSLYFNRGYYLANWYDRGVGQSVRPVSE